MSAEVTFYGRSDDLAYADGDVVGCDEYNTDDATFEVVCEGGMTCFIRVRYTKHGTWAVEIAPADEDVPMPNATAIMAHAYSAGLIVPSVISVSHVPS